MDTNHDRGRSASRSPYLGPEFETSNKRKESPRSETSSGSKRSRVQMPLNSPTDSGKASRAGEEVRVSPLEGSLRLRGDKRERPQSRGASPNGQDIEGRPFITGSSRSPLDKERRRHKHRRREGEVERRTDRGAPDQESPSRKRRRDKQGGVDGGMREAGEITEGRYRDRDRDVDQWHRSRSHSRPKSREGADGARPKAEVPASKPPRDSRPDAPPKSLASTRLAGIPEDLRQAALAAQKRRQEAEAAAQQEKAAAEAAVERLKEAEASLAGAEGRINTNKHSPIVWKKSDQQSPQTKIRTLTASERAQEELAAFQGLQSLGIDNSAPAAVKASPSGSDSQIGDLPERGESVEAAPAVGIKSRWLLDDEEDLTAVNGQAKEEELHMAALNKEEQQDLEITREMEDHEREWEDDDDDISEFQRTRPPVNMLNSSRRVDACFERLNRISEGTYGVVHRARDKETNTICALKKIKMEKEQDGFPLTSIREINILLCFHHKNIVDVSEVAVGSGLDDIYMVMEFMEHDLRGLMEDMPEPFTVAETKNLMKQLLEGMAYLHGNWVLHRDLKTSNILYNNKGQLKICDFGLARQYGSPLRPYTHQVVTLYYRSIELLLGAKEYSTAIDIWSLGCIMAELLTKKILFQGNSEIDQIDKIFKVLGSPTEKMWPGHKQLEGVQKLKLREQRRTIREVLPAASRFDPNSGLTEAGFDLIEKMLAMDPKQRISAEQALEHEWFKEQPKAKENYLMPTYPTSKDGSNRIARQRLGSRAASPQKEGPNFGRTTESFSALFGKKK